DDTPVARLLPVYLDRLDQGIPAADAVYDLTREGWLEPWMRLEAQQDDEEARLAYMTPFFTVNRIPAIKPGASILATVTDPASRELPALVSHRYGSGRAAALTIGDLWRWGMKDAEQQERLAKTWRQLIRWAVNDVPNRATLSWSDGKSSALPLTDLAVSVRDQEFDPQDDASVELEVTPLEGEPRRVTTEPSLEEPGLFSANYLSGEEERGFRVRATVRDGSGEFVSEEVTARALNPLAEEFATIGAGETGRQFLASLASATGGELITWEDRSQLPDLLSELNLPMTEITQRPLWHSPWLFLLALSCFIGEWAIRRRRGFL
ncbi:MAG: hypothetical protein AAF236_14740, partial [Verrucomicrobiota bacterium]